MEVVDDSRSLIPIIEISALTRETDARHTIAAQIGEACRDCGFFYITGHGVDEELQQRLERLSRQFFAQDMESKMEISMFRIFNYPPYDGSPEGEPPWGVGEHTDYGLLTILKQDEAGGLQVKSQTRWMDAHPVPGSFVCNIGDMLDRLTGGRYHSTPHRVRNLSNRDRLSFPFFFDPNFNAEVAPIALDESMPDDRDERWDRASVREFRGRYGDYLLSKVAKVFPQLGREVL
ncbi:MAG: hypothetical protein MOB07_20235 [Acidobacteria bacterium]|nr:hypothetical protein [Acidobacteriota bacterium]